MSESLLETIQTLHHRATRLEEEAASLRDELARVAKALISPASVVARYVIEGEAYEITQADVEKIQTRLVKPATEEVLYELAAVKKMAKRLKERPLDEQHEYFFKTVEAIRAASLSDGTAIEDETEAA